jgi:spore coat protein Z
MGCTNGNSSTSGCVCEVVQAILDIQQAIEEAKCDCSSNCFTEPLGSISPHHHHHKRRNADTRVIVLKNADGSPFHAFFKGHHHCVSIYFRVEDVFDNCCATLRVLRPLKFGEDKDEHGHGHDLVTADLMSDDGKCIDMDKVCKVEDFAATNDCITVDLHCFCAVQCIEDVDLNICKY